MKRLALLSTLLSTCLITHSLNAALLIQSRDAQNHLSTIYIEADKARIEMPNNEGYVVMDVAKKTMKAVIHKQRMVMDMSEFLQDSNRQPAAKKYVDTYTKSMGLGPKIVGYETEEVALYANDKYCSSLFVSVEAMRDMGVKKFSHALVNMERNMDAKFSAMTGMNMSALIDPCEEAERKASIQLRDRGFPLKSIDSNKRLESIVVKINKKARLPVNAFKIPADYTSTNPSKMMNDKMKKMQPQMKEMMNNMTPEMQKMIQQKMQQFQQ